MADIPVRLALVGLVVLVVAAATLGWRRYQAHVQRGPATHPRVPFPLIAGSARTWVVFTTPYCANCGPASERLREADPVANVVTVDAARERELAQAFSVRSAPTMLLADHEGEVQARLVGVEALERYLARPMSGSGQ